MKVGPVGFLVASTRDVYIERGDSGFGPEHVEGWGCHPLPFTVTEVGAEDRAESGAEKFATSSAALSHSWGWAGGVNPGVVGMWMRPPRGECR